MDYTKLPRHLIYKDRKDLDDFPVNSKFDYQFMEEVFLKLLESRPFIKESYEAPELILNIFNNARYITTLICMENHPNHYFRKYLRIAGSDDSNVTIANHAMPATMALVKNYLCHYMPNFYSGSRIVEDITENFNTVEWKEYTHGGYDDFNKLVIANDFISEGWLSDPNFKPRDMREIVDDPFVTVRDISGNIDYIMKSLEKGVEISDEEIAPLNAMYKKLESWFPSDFPDDIQKELALGKISDRLKKLDPNNAFEFVNLMNDMEKSLYNGTPVSPKTKEEIDKYLKKTLGVSMDEIEAASQSEQTDNENKNDSQIADLKAENDYLKDQLAQQQEELNKDFEEQTKTIQELKEEISRLKEEKNSTKPDEQSKSELNRLITENKEPTLAVQSYKDQGKGLTAPEAAILITAICLEMNQIPANGRESLAPIIEFCWGKSSSTSSEALRRKVTKESVEKLACKFEQLTPKLARIIRELPQKLEERNNERLMQINPNVNK